MDQPSPHTVLLVDDDALVRWTTGQMVEEAGFIVLLAENADAALKVFEAREVDILLTDVHMPGSMDGFRLAQVVHERWPKVELIIVSGRLRPLQADIPDDGIFICKPFSEAELVNALTEKARLSTKH